MRANETKAASGEAVILVEALGHRGDGIAHIDGRVVHVPRSAPGDRLRIAYDGSGHGVAVERLSDGPDRVAPPCAHYEECGGCALQHIGAEAYRRFKEDSLRALLAAQGLAAAPVEPLTPVLPATRRRASFAFQCGADGQAVLGFYGARTHRAFDLQSCLVLRPEILAALPVLRRALGACLAPGSKGRMHITATETGLDLDVDLAQPSAPLIAAFLRETKPLDLARLTVAGAPAVLHRQPVIRIDGIAVTLPPRAFLQPSEEGERALIAAVKEGVGRSRRVLDLFCGLGTFALPLARSAQIHAVDSDEALLGALTDAHRHAQGLKPVTVETRDLMRSPLSARALTAFDAAVLDPPRAGAKAQTEALAQAGVPRIVAVSCNAESFARDARRLVEAGYAMAWIRPLDQFLWSAHIELVALFTRVAKR